MSLSTVNAGSTDTSLDNLSVSAAYFNSLLGTAEQMGTSRASLLQALSLDAEMLQDKERRISARLFLTLLDTIIATGGRDDIGLVMAEQARPGTFSALGYAAMSCATLGEAAALIPVYEDVVLDIGVTTLDVQGDIALLAWQAKHPAGQTRALHDVIVAGWFCFAQWVTGLSGFYPLRVTFTHARPSDITHYQTLFCCELQFASPRNAIEFDAKFLRIPIVQADHAFNRLMRSKADELMAQLATSGSMRQRVVTLLQTSLPRQQVTLATAAVALSLGERTLRRRLAEEHCSFQQILTEVRVRLASLYLKDPTLTLLDIALLLGYADQSSFTTAFKSWHGFTPGHWREELRR